MRELFAQSARTREGETALVHLGAFGAWRRRRRLCGWIARVRYGVNRVSLLISLLVRHACTRGERWSVFQWITLHYWPRCLRGSRIFTPVRAHARRMGRIKPLESVGRHERRHGGRRLRDKRTLSADGSSFPPGGGIRIKVRAWEPWGEVESRLRPR